MSFRMAIEEGDDFLRFGGLADGIGDIEREEIRVREKAIHRLEAMWIGVHVPSMFPAHARHRGLRGVEHALRLGTDELCSRLDLFQTGTMSTPCAAASTQARSCALA